MMEKHGIQNHSTFTGKERDKEKERSRGPFASERGDEPRSGIPYCSVYSYTYFGARYMDHELMTMWLSVDPMSDKYPSISPYAYCTWNPVKLVDPDGMEIWINNGDGKFKYTAGMSSEGLKGFAKKTVDALNDIYNKGGDEGVDLINTLCSSKNIFNIKEQETDKVSEFNESNTIDAYARNNQTFIDHWQDFFKHGHKFGSGGDVMWNTEGYMIFTEKGLRNDPTYQLLHELCHAYDANFGTMDDRLFNGLKIKEWSACMKANCIGSFMGFPQQTIYGGGVEEKSGRYIPCSGIALFNDGDLINPFMDF